MREYQRGDDEAFDTLYERHSPRVYGYFLTKVRNEEEASDLLQQTFFKVHQHRKSYRSEFPFLAWLFSIARNGWIDSLRKTKEIPVDFSEKIFEPQDAGRGDEDQEELWKRLSEAMPQLTPAHQQMLELRYLAGLSFEDISSRLEIQEVSVRKRVSRSLGELRKVLGFRHPRRTT